MRVDMKEIIFKEESYKIIGACFAVHNALGTGFLEAVYQEALEKEFIEQNIPYKKEIKLDLYYKNSKLNKTYRADFICYDKIILEIKTVNQMPLAFYNQIKNYLKATNYKLGILINFGKPSLEFKRILNPIRNSY